MKSDESFRSLDFMVHTRLWGSQVILQIFLGTLVPLALLAANQLWTFSEARRKAMYMAAGGLTLIGIFAMRWNVVIGGQLFSKSFLGYTSYKMELVAREGLVPAIAADAPSVCDLPGAGETPAALAGGRGPQSLRRLPCRNRSGRRWSARSGSWPQRVASIERARRFERPRGAAGDPGPAPLGPSAGRNARHVRHPAGGGTGAAGAGRRLPAARPHRIRNSARQAGIAAGIAYALLWLGWAARSTATERLKTALNSLTAVLVLSPLLWEATVRFHCHRRLDRAAMSCWSSPFSA